MAICALTSRRVIGWTSGSISLPAPSRKENVTLSLASAESSPSYADR